MAATVALNERWADNAGVRNRRLVKYTGPTSYVATGDSFVPGDVFLSEIENYPSAIAFDGSGNIRFLVYDLTNESYRWFSAAGTEIAAGVDLSAFSVYIEFAGK